MNNITDLINRLKYNALLHVRDAALAGNEDPFIWAQVPTRFREAIKHMSDADIFALLQTHPDLITLEFDEAAPIGQILDMIEKGTPSSEIQRLINTWFKTHRGH